MAFLDDFNRIIIRSGTKLLGGNPTDKELSAFLKICDDLELRRDLIDITNRDQVRYILDRALDHHHFKFVH